MSKFGNFLEKNGIFREKVWKKVWILFKNVHQFRKYQIKLCKIWNLTKHYGVSILSDKHKTIADFYKFFSSKLWAKYQKCDMNLMRKVNNKKNYQIKNIQNLTKNKSEREREKVGRVRVRPVMSNCILTFSTNRV